MGETDAHAEPILSLLKKLRSSTRTDRRLHLEPQEREILLRDNIYDELCRLEAKALRGEWQLRGDNDNEESNGTSLETFGSGSGLTAAPGTSAGLSVVPLGAQSRGASLLLREEADLIRRRKTR